MLLIKNEKGQALILVLLFSLVGTLLVAAVLYMVMRATEMSGMQKRFQTALDAAHAGVGVEAQFLRGGTVFTMNSPIVVGGTLTVDPTGSACFMKKLFVEYSQWGTDCSAAEESVDPTQAPDITFEVKGQNTNYQMFAKITDTRRGLTATRPEGVKDPSGVAYVGQERSGLFIQPQAYMFYTVEVASRDETRGEIARISFDYAW